MSAPGFDRLHESVQYHVVNSMGWDGLRPLQEAAVVPIHEGRDCVLLAPTAGGKTEAAVLPVISRMLEGNWDGLSVLYICPLRALVNNLGPRLERYFGFVGRRVNTWHGDTPQGDRKRIRKDPPHVLVTTPESIEAQLISAFTNEQRFFGNVRVAIIDEVHAFAASDRGWHLLAVLSRLEELTGQRIQRIGLSATIGNPQIICDWLAAPAETGQGPTVIAPRSEPPKAPEIATDFVASLANAAQVISQLHRGEKRLVFVDSRQRAEEIGDALQRRGVQTFVSHSSLGVDERRQAEKAFAEASDCVIVSTSTLELGIDVGDLDRVIQIDAPASVASFLQRMGRTGRRSGTTRNCTFLATDHAGLLRAAALLDLHARDYVEPIEPPAKPYHLLSQQVLAQILQHKGVSRTSWRRGLESFIGKAGLRAEAGDETLDLLEQRGLVAADGGIYWFTQTGERTLGGLNFLDLMSIFTSEDLLQVRHGNREVGKVDRITFVRKGKTESLLLGGKAWRVIDIKWDKGIVSVEPTSGPGRSRWLGDGPPMSYALAQAVRRVVTGVENSPSLSTRAKAAISDARADLWWFQPDSTTLHSPVAGKIEWYTYAGTIANISLAWRLQELLGHEVKCDEFSVAFASAVGSRGAMAAIDTIRKEPPPFNPTAFRPLAEKLKFYDTLPANRVTEMITARYQTADDVRKVMAEPVRVAASRG